MYALDLFCGEGGVSEGLRRAGFTPVGVDVNDDHLDRKTRPRPKPLRRYPFESHEGDALGILEWLIGGGSIGRLTLDDLAVIVASPPCQLFSPITQTGVRVKEYDHVDLIGPTRELLERTGKPYVIENVPQAAAAGVMRADVMLCGSMFDPPLDVMRHRVFESNVPLEQPMWPCRHKLWAPRFPQRDYRRDGGGNPTDYLMRVVPVYGGTRFAGDNELRKRAMGIDWMSRDGLSEAIPPVYAEFVAGQLMRHVTAGQVAA